jgi:hypothetical protein
MEPVSEGTMAAPAPDDGKTQAAGEQSVTATVIDDRKTEPLGEQTLAAPLARDRRARLAIECGIGCLLGLITYFALGFNHLLAFHKIGWIFSFSVKEPYWDPATYFLGWNYFRHAPWGWPPGANPSYGMEFGASIAFADAIPIMAFICKPFSHWLGDNFQYIGLWILICCLLQGLFGMLVASRIVDRLVPKILIAGFFLAPVAMLDQTWNQYSKMGHWLVLWGLYLCLSERRGRIRWVWPILAALAVTTNFYMTPLVLTLWIADAVKAAIVQSRRVPWLLVEGVAVCAAVLGVMDATGYFLIPAKSSLTEDFGKFATNLLGPIDPWWNSFFFKGLPKSPYWLAEGDCFLGFGVILLTAMAVYELLRAGIPRRALLINAPLTIGALGLTLFSLSNKIAFGSHVLVIPWLWGGLGRTFRASGRMIWPPYYAFYLLVFYLVTRSLRPWRATAVLAAALLLQVVDFSPLYTSLRSFNLQRREWVSPLKDPFWARAMTKYHAIVVTPSGALFHYEPIAYLGSEHQVPTNACSLARIPPLGTISAERESALRANHPNPEFLYIVPDSAYFAELVRGLGKEHGVGRINGYNVIAPYWFADPQNTAPGSLHQAGPDWAPSNK